MCLLRVSTKLGRERKSLPRPFAFRANALLVRLGIFAKPVRQWYIRSPENLAVYRNIDVL